MTQSIIVLAVPFIVAAVSQIVKKYVLPLIVEVEKTHNWVIVLAVAIISYISAIIQGASTGTIDPVSTTTFVNAIIAFVGSTGIFHLASSVTTSSSQS